MRIVCISDTHNLARNGPELQRIWARVPVGIDVLLSHSPAHGIQVVDL